MKYVAILFIALLLIACAPASALPPANGEPTIAVQTCTLIAEYGGVSGMTLVRCADMQTGAVCYLMDGLESGGIDCLPDSKTWVGWRK